MHAGELEGDHAEIPGEMDHEEGKRLAAAGRIAPDDRGGIHASANSDSAETVLNPHFNLTLSMKYTILSMKSIIPGEVSERGGCWRSQWCTFIRGRTCRQGLLQPTRVRFHIVSYWFNAGLYCFIPV